MYKRQVLDHRIYEQNRQPDEYALVLISIYEDFLWTGDGSLILARKGDIKYIADSLINRFYDAKHGLIRSDTEIWERNLSPGFEFAHQIIAIQGLKSAENVLSLVYDQNTVFRYRDTRNELQKNIARKFAKYVDPQHQRILKRINQDESVSWHLQDDASIFYGLSLDKLNFDGPILDKTLDVAKSITSFIGGLYRYNPSIDVIPTHINGPWVFPTLHYGQVLAEQKEFNQAESILNWVDYVAIPRNAPEFSEHLAPYAQDETFFDMDGGIGLPWSAAEYIKTIFKFIGINVVGPCQIEIKPNLPQRLSDVQLQKLKVCRNEINIKIKGWGSEIKSWSKDGVKQSDAKIIINAKETKEIEMEMVEKRKVKSGNPNGVCLLYTSDAADE